MNHGRSGPAAARRASPLLAGLVGAAGLVVLLAGTGVAVLDGADTATALPPDRAVEAFRESVRASPAPASSAAPAPTARPTGDATAPAGPASRPTAAVAAPAPSPVPAAAATSTAAARPEVPEGVYRYATEGFEEVDAFGGARHDYPAETTVTYRRSGCGTAERWQPLQERSGTVETCPGPAGTSVRRTEQSREFFGQRQVESYACDPAPAALPDDRRPGAQSRGTCRSDDSTVEVVTTVVGTEVLDVGGTPVEVVRVRVDGVVTGSVRGRADREVWLRSTDGLLVQATGDTDTDADTPAGTVRYREAYRLRLASLAPLR